MHFCRLNKNNLKSLNKDFKNNKLETELYTFPVTITHHLRRKNKYCVSLQIYYYN